MRAEMVEYYFHDTGVYCSLVFFIACAWADAQHGEPDEYLTPEGRIAHYNGTLLQEDIAWQIQDHVKPRGDN